MDVISITTVPWRTDKFATILESLLAQESIKPFKIVITISKQNFSNWHEQFSKESIKLIDKHNIEVVEQDEDYTTYKRYSPLLTGNNVLVADDDIIHASTWLKQFQITAERYPHDILVNKPLGYFAKFIRETLFTRLYSNTDKHALLGQIDNTARLAINMGVYIPANVLDDEFFNFKLATEICDTDDESWLFAHILHNNLNIRYCLCSTRYFNTYPSNAYQKQALCNKENIFTLSKRFVALSKKYIAVNNFINTINTINTHN